MFVLFPGSMPSMEEGVTNVSPGREADTHFPSFGRASIKRNKQTTVSENEYHPLGLFHSSGGA